ncbi:hypothetical protein LJC21_01760 [Bacteroides sp. OttesenSCG-928-E20]|nr:hypothetical protein [Bacteroides sp. OttesenSCG-928-N06]MDL2299416.1 hypothetical protein [Bacteroides sp. OttesenSCG-928-E20]MDL2304181.1 hypothetical protein [Bacteroides sp. OttesenSCG-928-D19]
MEVIYHKDVAEYLNELVDVLYHKEYFGFKDAAYDYVDWIFEQIESSIHKMHKKVAPKYFDRYGQRLFYVVYKRNAHTSWYVFFQKQEDTYLIRYIGNNHNCAQYILL